MKINISNLSEGVHTYDLSGDVGTLGLEANFQGIVDTHVTLEKSMNQIVATIDASCKGIFICDRCGNEFEEQVQTEFITLYSWENDEAKGEEDDFYVLQPDENMIDLSKNVREYLTLSVPLKLLCNRAECDIPKHTVNEQKTIDPRWEQLQKLLKQENN
ncbi:MAG: DUF177 domain-containing protein [Ignavibacteriales bacterium]|nr:DUF177 domain-containing protein [Ignavibacteriales bacterium]